MGSKLEYYIKNLRLRRDHYEKQLSFVETWNTIDNERTWFLYRPEDLSNTEKSEIEIRFVKYVNECVLYCTTCSYLASIMEFSAQGNTPFALEYTLWNTLEEITVRLIAYLRKFSSEMYSYVISIKNTDDILNYHTTHEKEYERFYLITNHWLEEVNLLMNQCRLIGALYDS